MTCLPKIGSDPFVRADAAERERERERERAKHTPQCEKRGTRGEGNSVQILWL
jgi:hypothetical protein